MAKNMAKEKVKMPELDPNVRTKNFEEVAQGYTEAMALEEAARCLNCKNKPCVSGCPVNVRIPEFIEKAAAGDFIGAYEIIKTTNALPAVCGRLLRPEAIQLGTPRRQRLSRADHYSSRRPFAPIPVKCWTKKRRFCALWKWSIPTLCASCVFLAIPQRTG